MLFSGHFDLERDFLFPEYAYNHMGLKCTVFCLKEYNNFPPQKNVSLHLSSHRFVFYIIAKLWIQSLFAQVLFIFLELIDCRPWLSELMHLHL